MAVVFDKPHALADVPLHYCPGCTHGIVHRLVAEVIDELQIEGKTIGIVGFGAACETAMQPLCADLAGVTRLRTYLVGEL